MRQESVMQESNGMDTRLRQCYLVIARNKKQPHVLNDSFADASVNLSVFRGQYKVSPPLPFLWRYVLQGTSVNFILLRGEQAR